MFRCVFKSQSKEPFIQNWKLWLVLTKNSKIFIAFLLLGIWLFTTSKQSKLHLKKHFALLALPVIWTAQPFINPVALIKPKTECSTNSDDLRLFLTLDTDLHRPVLLQWKLHSLSSVNIGSLYSNYRSTALMTTCKNIMSPLLQL